MNREQFEYFCKAQTKLHSICIRIYEDCSLTVLQDFYVRGTRQIENDIPLTLTITPSVSESSIRILDEGQFVLGCVQIRETGQAVLLGPIRSEEVNQIDIVNVMRLYHLPKDMQTSISRFLRSTPVMPLENFLLLLSMFHLMTNNAIVPIQEIMLKNSDIHSTGKTKTAFITTADVERTAGAFIHYDEALVYYIKNGCVAEIQSLNYEDFPRTVGQLAPNQLRQFKNMLLSLNTICLRAAISGGLDSEIAYHLGEQYAQKIESASSYSTLEPLSSMIRMDYCTRVHDLQFPRTNNIYITRATYYIQENIYTKITVAQLAEYCGISPEYLSVLAKENLHCTMARYIVRRKIAEAKKLLRFTDKSLAEIANLLCFSSQSHFQRDFKKIRGITPNDYRKQYRLESKAQENA